jgi:NADPH:quinone reductase
MNKAIRIAQTGGPEVLSWQDHQIGEPTAGSIRVRHSAIGLNYIDIYHRSGVYPVPLPATLGLAGSGEVTAVGVGVSNWSVGDRIVYAGGPLGAYSQERLLPAERAVPQPTGIADEIAASIIFSGLTAQFLVRQTYKVKPGDTVLIHAAAGNVGLLLCQWAKHLGATVIGTVGTDDKAELVRRHGCDHAIVYSRQDFVAEVERVTGGAKAHVVYDSVGKDTFLGSMDCLRPMGLLVTFGVASGDTPLLDPRLLLSKGSLFVTRPSFGHYMGSAAGYQVAAKELLDLVEAGILKVEAPRRFALEDVKTAHRAMEARQTTGASLLIP